MPILRDRIGGEYRPLLPFCHCSSSAAASPSAGAGCTVISYAELPPPPLPHPCTAKVLACEVQHRRYSTVTMAPRSVESGGTWSRCTLHSDISINFKAALPTHHCMSGIAKACSALLCCDIYSTCTPRYTHARDPPTTGTSAVGGRRCLAMLPATRDARLVELVDTAEQSQQMPAGGVGGWPRRWSMVGLERRASHTFPFLLGHSSPLTPHCLQSIGPGLLDRSIALYRAAAVCPCPNHRGPSSCRPMQGSASSRPSPLFSFRLTDFLHGSLARPACLPAALPLGPSSCARLPLLSSPPLSADRRPWAVALCADIARLFPHKQGSSSFLATPTVAPPTPEIGCHNPAPSSNKR